MAVVDSSVLIHLLRIGKINLLKEYFGKIMITREVYNELMSGNVGVGEIELGIKEWITLKEVEILDIKRVAKSEGIEDADASVILLAKQDEKILLSNDYALISVAKSYGVKCWWITSFILHCLRKDIVTKEESKKILYNLVESGLRLNNTVYSVILNEIDRM